MSEQTAVAEDFQAYKASRVTPLTEVAESTEANGAAATDTTVTEEPKTADPEGGDKKKGGWQRRIEKLERENNELKQKVSEGNGKPLAQDAGAGKSEPTKAAVADGRPAKPDLSKFDTYEQYQDALDEYQDKLTDWKIEQREKSRAEQDRQNEARRQQEAAQKTWNDRLNAAKSRLTDFDDVVQGAIADHDIRVSPTMERVILESEHGPEIVYHLAKHPDEAARIAALPPEKAALALGRIEAKVAPEAEPAKPAKTVSNAPPPVKPVGSSASTGRSVDDAGDNYQAYKAARLKARR